MTIKTVTVGIQVLDPITGSKYRGYLTGISKRSILRELKLHSSWNKLDKMIVPKGSVLAKFTDKDWEDYPLILKSGNEKFPYVVDTINRDPYKPQTIQVNLHSVENMSYIEAVAVKKKLVKAMKETK